MTATVGALDGYTVGVTADRRAEEQASLLERRGARVVLGPTIRTSPLIDDDALHRATLRVIDAPPDLVVLTTGVGARSWLAAAESHGVGAPLLGALGRATILTRGPKALGAAVTAGLTVSWNAPTARSFEVIEHVVANAPPAARIVVQVDGSGEGPIVERLRAAGFEVESVAAYRWTWPSDLGPAQRLVQAVAERSVDAVTFTAAPAMRNFFHLARQAQAADDVVGAFAERAVLAVCVGPACAEEAARHGVADPVVPAQARVGAMVQAFTAAVAPRRQVFSLAGVELVIQGRLVRTATGEAVRLSDRERDLLGALSRRPGAVVSKPALLREVWGAAESDTHVVEVAVGRLRQRLAAVGVTIETVVRRGYRLSG